MKNLLTLPMAALLAGAFSVAQAAKCPSESYGAINFKSYGSNKCVAIIDANGDQRNDAINIPNTVTVDSVYYFREGVVDDMTVNSTIVLPFDAKGNKTNSKCSINGSTLKSITGITYNDSEKKWKALANYVSSGNDLTANTPYLFSHNSGTVKNGVGYIGFGGDCTFDMNTSTINDQKFDASKTVNGTTGLKGTWTFKGTYEKIVFDENTKKGVYGFASKTEGKFSIGQFVKAGTGASVPPMRAYLVYNSQGNSQGNNQDNNQDNSQGNSQSNSPKVTAKARAISSAEEIDESVLLPQSIDIVMMSAEDPEGEAPATEECFQDGDGIFEVKDIVVNGNIVKTACIDGKSEARLQTLDIPEDVVVDSIAYNREFAQQKATTVMFPFAISPNNVSTAVFYKTVAIVKYCPQCEWTLEVNKLLSTDTLEANKPYIAWTGSSTLSFNTARYNAELNKIIRSITLSTKGPLSYNFESTITSNGNIQTANWSFVGTYSKITFNDENKKGIYGFAANAQGSSIQPGQFVKAGTGATVPPMRAYLKYNAASALAKAAAGTEIAEENLPETITVKFIDGDGSTLSIGQMNTITGEITMDENKWFDMKGRVLNKKPTTKGTYYNKGQKVIIK